MLLAIDVGNTQTVIGLFNEPTSCVDHWRIATVAERTSDELALMFQQFLGFHGFTFDDALDGLAIASGVPAGHRRAARDDRALLRLRGAGASSRACAPACRSSTTTRRRSAPTASPTRWAPTTSTAGPTIVVDFGTANTVDAVSAKGEYLGGAIFPGIEISHRRAVRARRRAAQRRAGRAEERDRQVDDRGDPVGRGLRLQRPGRRASCDRFEAELGPSTVVATGGLAELIMPHSRTIQHFEPWLTLQGLRIVHERNS